jgi:vitamin B12 transporter
LKKTVILSILASTTLLADQAVNIGTITVKAPAETVEKHLLTSDTDKISKSEIEENGYRSVADALENKIPFSVNGGIGQTESIYLRGMDNGKTLFLIDGVRANDITGITAEAFSQHLLLNDMEEINIIKGAQSGVYGADAVAGVISINTEKPKDGLHTKITSAIGSYGYKSNGLSISYKNELLYAKANGSKTIATGFSAAAPKKGSSGYGKFDSSLESDRYSNAYNSFLLGLTPTKKDVVEASYKKIDSFTAYDDGWPTNPNDGSSYTNARQIFISTSYKHTFETASIKSFYNESIFERTQYGGYNGKQKEFGIEGKNNYLKDSYLSYGINRLLNTVKTSGGSEIDKGFSSIGVFVSNTNLFGNLLLTENIRKDYYSDFDDKTTGKLGAKLLFDKALIFSNYAVAYTTPTSYQLYGDGGVWVAANPNVKPENSRSFDVGFEYGGLKVTYFYNNIKDLIDYTDPDGWGPMPGYYYNTSGNSIVQGYEASYEKSIQNFVIGASYQRLDAKDANKEKLKARPSYTAGSFVKYYHNTSSTITANISYIGDRIDSSKAQTGNYALVDMTATTLISKNVDIFAKAKNILNRYYQTVDGYNGYGASIYLGANIKF